MCYGEERVGILDIGRDEWLEWDRERLRFFGGRTNNGLVRVARFMDLEGR